MNRADFTVLLVRALELKGTDQDSAAFSDVQKDADYRNELAIAKQLGIVTGYEGNMFKPNSELSRQDMMVIAYRALAAAGKKASGSATLESYSDADRIADYARDSLAALVKFGIVSGKDGKLAPDDTLTRAEAAVIVYRIWNL
uniref:S-layer homology domain-containing protein n=1 Tax=Paenibacillus sp. FSL L8-0436 TaxID=2954686 RepID=UPI00406BFF53